MTGHNKTQTTQALREWVRERDDYTCHYCARRGGLLRDPDGSLWNVDHKTPRILGGSNLEENLVLACFCCNVAKGTMPYWEFIDRCVDGLHVGPPTTILDLAPAAAVRLAAERRRVCLAVEQLRAGLMTVFDDAVSS